MTLKSRKERWLSKAADDRSCSQTENPDSGVDSNFGAAMVLGLSFSPFPGSAGDFGSLLFTDA